MKKKGAKQNKLQISYKHFLAASSFILAAGILSLIIFSTTHISEAATCGGAVVCNCGDTVTSNYTLTNDLQCNNSNGLTVGNDNITIDGNGYSLSLSNTSNSRQNDAISITNFSNITIQNLTIEGLFRKDIVVSGVLGTPVTNINILNNSLNDPRYAIHFSYVDNSTVSGNTFSNIDNIGIWFSAGTTNLSVDSNTFLFSSNPFTQPSSGVTFNNNTIINSRENVGTAVSSTYTNNQVIDNANNKMITWNEISRLYNLGDTINLSFDLNDFSGVACPTCTYSISSSPAETITHGLTANTVNGSFTVNRKGTYTVTITITDPQGNYFTKNYLFLVDASGNKTTRYYYTADLPVHGQGAGTDDKALKLTAPTSDAQWQCDQWVGNAIDDIPDNPMAILNQIDLEVWYRNLPRPIPTAPGAGTPSVIALQRYAGYNTTHELPAPGTWDVPFLMYAAPYNPLDPGNKIARNFSSLDIAMDYPWSWYGMELKFIVQTYNDGPQLQTFTSDLSYADFNYTYAESPNIKTYNNDRITVLSATQDASSDPLSTKIILNGTGDADITLDNFNQPFLNSSATIATDGAGTTATTLHLTGLTGTTTIENPLTLQIVPPNNEAVDVTIDTWETSGAFYKKWTENGTVTNLSTNHIVGSLKPVTEYSVKVDGIEIGKYTTNGSGELTFNYTGGYSTKTFEITGAALPMGGLSAFSGDALITINNGTTQTNNTEVTLNLTAPNAAQMIISNNSDFSGNDWEPFSVEKSWVLTDGYGDKTVYVQYRNASDQPSAVVSDTITYTEQIIPEKNANEGIICNALPTGINVGDLLKISQAKTVYFIGADKCRHTFPNEPTYFTWFADFNNVKTINIETIAQINLGSNITVRPGSALIKINTDDHVYAVEPGAKIRAIADEAKARSLYGNNWANLIIDIPDVFFMDYQVGSALDTYPNGTLFQYINDDAVYYLDNSEKRLVMPTLVSKLFLSNYLIKNISKDFTFNSGAEFLDTTIADIMTWR